MTLFPGFDTRRIQTRGAAIHLRVGGAGPPLLLLHGFPQTHVHWHRVAPALAARFTVVVPDLRGYGDSGAPPSDERHAPYAKRALAQDQLDTMSALGFARFAVAGHDRGGRVAYRLALDHPEAVSALAVLDIVPTLEVWRRVDKGMALSTYHWFFLAQPNALPETLIGAAPDAYLDKTLDSWMGRGNAFADEARAEYRRCFRRPETIHAACEDYRAGATLDAEHDEADERVGRRIRCPVLCLAADQGRGGSAADSLATWRRWADDVDGHGLPCGHFLAEERPAEVIAGLDAFFTARR